jgi:hypothetical protein
MRFFRVFLPQAGAEPAEMADRATFIREGFSWPALLFGPIWLLARGLWRPLGIWCVGAILVALAFRYGHVSRDAGGWLYLLSALYLGFEGRGFVAATVERRGFALVDVVAGADRIGAEHAFFGRWPAETQVAAAVSAARPNIPVAPPHVIGMFPEAGG